VAGRGFATVCRSASISACKYFAGGLDDTGSDDEAPVAEFAVVHALAVLSEEGEFALDASGTCRL